MAGWCEFCKSHSCHDIAQWWGEDDDSEKENENCDLHGGGNSKVKACACCNSFFIDKSHVNQATLCTFKKYSLRWLKTPKVKHKSLRLLANHGITIIIANTKILLRIVTGEAACMSESRVQANLSMEWPMGIYTHRQFPTMQVLTFTFITWGVLGVCWAKKLDAL